jgi:hypothetical protein
MLTCLKTFKPINGFNPNYCWNYCEDRANIDDLIYLTIKILNEKGYKTISCCSSHLEDGSKIHIGFDEKNLNPPKNFRIYNRFDKDPYIFMTYNYNHRKFIFLHINGNIYEYIKVIKKAILIYFLNRKLYKWAKKLPKKIGFNLPINCSKNYNKYGEKGIKIIKKENKNDNKKSKKLNLIISS